MCFGHHTEKMQKVLLMFAGMPSTTKTNVQVLSKELKAYHAAVPLPAARDQNAALFRDMSIN